MPPDPMSMFGSLLKACISDRFEKRETRLEAEGILFLLLGAASSVLTTYALAAVGILV